MIARTLKARKALGSDLQKQNSAGGQTEQFSGQVKSKVSPSLFITRVRRKSATFLASS